MSYRNSICHAGMDYLTEMTCELIRATKKCKSKEKVVKNIYDCYKDAKKSEERVEKLFKEPKNKSKAIKLLCKTGKLDEKQAEEKYNEMNKNYKINRFYLEDYLLVAVYAEKKLSWEDIKYCHEHSFLPKSVIEKPFPIDEMKQELLKKGYTPLDETKDDNNKMEM